MGRALFSTIYRSAPAVHEEPEPEPTGVASFATWSQRNKFDPDSDEFFDDAEYEAFLLDDDHHDQHRAPTQAAAPPTSAEPVVDEPAPVFAVRQPLRWTSNTRVFRISETTTTGEPWTTVTADTTQQESTEASAANLASSEAAIPDLVRPMAMTMPIDIPRTSTPSSGSDSSAPATPPQAYSFGSIGTPGSYSFSMSPPSSVSPRLYTWARARHSASPGSPSTSRFTSSSARGSFPRVISASPALRA